MDLILLEPGNPEFVFGKAPDGGGNIDAIWRDAAALRGMGQCIELVSLHQGMQQQVTTDVGNAARTSGRPLVSEFTCVKYVDATSVKLNELYLLAQPLGTGAAQPTRLYIARYANSKTADVITIALRDALISEIQQQTHPDDMPTEQFKLSFTDILWSHSVQQADGLEPGAQAANVGLYRISP
ncbi:type VI secretion system tube protein Hcp [Janthinobacterium sp. JC611]|uniref:type VI secretion system tube protein Hcp n=1 Tax=Janthinobacterium sp. JC611 TaxID=2816201 RepID=UPI0020422972|nr:type VI secretion system tube protein Hcp [Janthinobacterium sp. JC611]